MDVYSKYCYIYILIFHFDMDAESRVSMLLGDPRKAIVTMVIPIVLSLLVSEVNMLADRAWCSGLGVEAVATISVVRPIYNVYVGLGTGLGVGAAAVISRKIGASKAGEASSCAVQALIIALLFSIVFTPVMYLCQDGLIETVGSSDIHDSCITYMTTFTLCLTLIVVNGVIAGILNGQGAAGLSTAMMMTLAIGNMILDPILIYGLDMGISGASLATVLATVMSILVGIRYLLGRRTYLSFGRSSLRMDGGHMREIGKAGIPQMLEFVVIYGMDAVLNMIIIICAGSEGLTIFSTPDAIVYIMVVPAIAIESALVAVASSAYGQGDMDRMRDAYVFSVKLGIGVIVGLVILVEIMPAVFMMPFTYTGDMADLKPQLTDTMRILALYAPFFSMTPICSAFPQAMKHPTYSVVLAIVRNLILIGLFWIAAGISLAAICWFLVMGHVIGATIVTSVTLLTYRGVRRSMSAQAA